jgi:hypothetical protein
MIPTGLQMIFGTVDWSLKDEYWIIESGRKTNNIGKLRLIKVEQNSMIGVTSYYRVLALFDSPTNEMVSPHSSTF